MKLYRAISQDEYQALAGGQFAVSPNSIEGKWFAESFADAVRWGKAMVFDPSFVVVEIELPQRIADSLFRIALLDGIGPARFAEIKQLDAATIINYSIDY